jgi:hypothetical protein
MDRHFHSHRPRLAIGAAATLLLGTLLIGCGRADRPPQASAQQTATQQTAAASSGSFDPCALLTKEEVQAAVGWAVATATPHVNGESGHCVYEGERGAAYLEQVEAGVIQCWPNFPCASDMPKSFGSSEELAAYRESLYESNYSGPPPTIQPIDGLGVPAIVHQLMDNYTVEMWLGYQRLAYVQLWESEDAARSLAEKVLARAK